MDFNFTEQEINFRNEVKNWLSDNLPKNISEKVRKYQRLHKEDSVRQDPSGKTQRCGRFK